MEYELYHYGVLGMKCGIRRYQNKDGSLTEAGRKRYAGEKGQKTLTKDVSQIEAKVRKLQSKKSTSKNVSEIEFLNRMKSGLINNLDSKKIENGEKYIVEMESGSSRKDSTVDALNNIDRYKDPVDKVIAVTQDCIPFGTGGRNNFPVLIGDKNLEKRTDEAAILGLKALEKYRRELGYGDLGREDPDAPYDKWDKEWFLYEDQTIGLGLVADLINRGYTPQQVGKLVDVVSENEEAWSRKYGYGQTGQTKKTNTEELADDVVFDITWGNYDDALKKFANYAYKVKKEHR